MKTIFYFILVSLSINSCKKIEDKRAPTVFEKIKQVTPPAFAYVNPSCTPTLNNTSCPIANFRITYTNAPIVRLDNKILRFEIHNDQNDMLTIDFSPFIEGESAVYDLVQTFPMYPDYSACISFNADKFDPYYKFQGITTPSSAHQLHVKYIPSTNSYDMVFCDTEFAYNSGTATTTMSGKFNFTY